MNLDKKYCIEFLKNLLSIPSPTGDTQEAVDFIANEFQSLGIKTKYTKKGALIATITGKQEDIIMFSAHVDTLGLMVKDILDNGKIRISLLGGYAPVTIEGNYVTIKTHDNRKYRGTVLFDHQSIHTYEDVSSERKIDDMYIRLDEKIKTKDDIRKLGINVGDFISLDPNIEVLDNGFIKSRHLDDKSGICSLMGIAKYLVEQEITPQYTIQFFISNYEEIGHGSCAPIAPQTIEFIAVDMAAMGESQKSREDAVTVCAKDSSGPYDIHMRKQMIDLCIKHHIDYEVDIYKYYGSDASAMQRAGYDVPAIVIGPGVDASHAYERTHIEGILATIKLGIQYILKDK